jgi:hypothetical protein
MKIGGRGRKGFKRKRSYGCSMWAYILKVILKKK